MRSYSSSGSTAEVNTRLSELFEHTFSTQGLLSMLGSYWTEYYADSESLAKAVTGHVVQVGKLYKKLLDSILASNIIDIPSRDKQQFDLLVFSEEDALILDQNIVFLNTEIRDCEFLCSSLFEPGVVLERDVDFSVSDNGTFIFYVDIFNDENIVGSTSRIDVYPNRKILFWGTDIVLASEWIYERYGRFLYREMEDSISYKWLIQALMYFYANTKSLKHIENVLNIMYGVPFAQTEGEVVTDIYEVEPADNIKAITDDSQYTCIETTFRKYYAFPGAQVLVSVGDTLSRFQLMASFHSVDDYITDPDFWETCPFPEALVEGDSSQLSAEMRAELLGNVLKYNMIYVNLVETYQTMDTYEAQIEEVMNLLKDSIPVYLYPVIGTTFRIYLKDTVLDDDDRNTDSNELDQYDYQFINGYAVWDSRVSTSRLIFSGEADYTGGPADCSGNPKDHGSYLSESGKQYLFDGKCTYGGPGVYARNRYMAYYSGTLFDGSCDYSPNFQYVHDADNEEFTITGFGIKETDNFYFTSANLIHFQCCDYSGNYTHDNTAAEATDSGYKSEGHYLYGVNFIPFVENEFAMSVEDFSDEIGVDDSGSEPVLACTLSDTVDVSDDDGFSITITRAS